MEEIRLKAQIRDEVGKEAVKKLRAQGLIPAVVYKDAKSQNIKIDQKQLREAVHTKAGENVIIDLQLEGDKAKGKKGGRPTIIKEIQYHPLKGDIFHVDLNEISLTEEITVKVPIEVKGEAVGVKDGGVLEHVLWEIEIECLPTQIPENIPVRVDDLKIGDGVLVKDLEISAGIKVLSDPESSVVHVATPHVEKEEEPLVEGEEAKEPEVIMEKKPKEDEAEGEAPAKEK